MDDPSPSPTLARRIGDYELHELLSEGPVSSTFRAVQCSVHRQVILELVRPEYADAEMATDFFADVRAKAAVDHPLIASVYEAANNPQLGQFFTREWLGGQSVAQLLESAQKLSPLELARLLKRVADANIYLEGRAIPATALALSDIFVEDQGLTRMANIAIAGTRGEDAHVADVQMLGSFLGDLLCDEDSGATRMRTLLGWMADSERDPALTWQQIQHYAEQVEQQLTTPVATHLPAPTQHGHHPGQKKPQLAWILAPVVALTFLAFMLSRSETRQAPQLRDLSAVVEIAAGSHFTPDGQVVELPAFRLGAYEVSIGQYAKFLEQLAALPDDQRNAYDHPDQPAAKDGHLPDEWTEMLSAAKQGGQWRDMAIDLNCPVVLVDWWDAYAYARWQRGRLPTQNEWMAAVAKNPPGKTAAGYGPVDADPLDVTGNGLHGMGGNVAEWTHEDELDPSVPMTPRRPMLIGGSFRKPRDGVNAREWIESRSQRRDDLGFRILFEG